MASNSQKTWNKRDRKHTNAGKVRKAKEATHSTPSYAQLFAACGEPGKPVQK